MRVIVVGAGLGGLTLAHGLQQTGLEVTVYERDGARGRPQGVSLHCDDRGISALRACLPPAHLAMVEATMGGPREKTLVLDGDLAVVGVRPGSARPGRQVHRPLLRAVLQTGLDVHFGAAFTRYELRPDGGVRAWFADGSVVTGDVLVGADGIGSAVRRQRLPHAEVVDSGRRMLMGATPLRAVPGLADLIGDDPASVQGEAMMAVGVLRFTEPPAAARDRWLPALPVEAVDQLEDYVMWALPVGANPPFQHVVDHAWPQHTATLRIATIPPVPAWAPSPVTLIGDAIHLAPGFGGNLAMRDACRLRDALVDANDGRRDLVEAIGDYESQVR
ncbi:MAG TPA: NAD(P)/FAD-dependent oxidoreductase [Kutzneria sp.]|jgi:2-polyprenyl-6-methoxyphenol hydroxylase-like FAD-dependent oxidoreductase